MIRRFLDCVLALIVRGSRQGHETLSGLLGPAEMHRRIRLQQLAESGREPSAILLHFVIDDVGTRRNLRRFADLVYFCRSMVTPAGAIGYLDSRRLALLVPGSASSSLEGLVGHLLSRWGIVAVVQPLCTIDLVPPVPAANGAISDRWLRNDWVSNESAAAKRSVAAGRRRHVAAASDFSDCRARGQASQAARRAMRISEVALAAVGLVLLAPLLLLVALTIKITSPGPILQVDQRLGRRGRPCRVYRFRAQVAEPAAADLTKVGGFLQETGLEQLPQLWNVLRGDFTR